jgi:non-ribosomal peptide synthetase component E (peptide arylation enzyme)
VERLKLTSEDIIGMVSPAIVGPNIPGYFGAPMVGAKVVMLENFQVEETLKLIAREKVTVLGGSPALLLTMVRHPSFDRYDYGSLRLVICGGASLEYAVGLEIETRMGCTVCQFFGATDCGTAFFTSPDDPQEIRIGTAGRPLLGGWVKIVNKGGKPVPEGAVGEILMTGPAASDGYLGDDETNKAVWTEDGWFRTGDLAKLDKLGNLIHVGRIKDVIIRGGDNVSPSEIEHILERHPKVSLVAVVGMPDPVMGQRVCAFVEPRTGQGLTFEKMITFLEKEGLRSYMLPERLEIVDQMPISGEGKIYKRLLVEQITDKLKAEGKI